MHGPGTRLARACAGAALVVCLVAAFAAVNRRPLQAAEAAPGNEVRALWVLRSSIASPESIATLVRSASRNGFNTLFVQVRGRGDAFYAGGIEPRGADLARQPDTFDPLADLLTAAHRNGLRVHAWINVNLVSSAVELPRAREHVVYRHPDWLMVPHELGQELSRTDVMSPGYVGKVARWTRERLDEIEGLYVSPIPPAAAAYVSRIVSDLARRYELDGVHFDYARYPNDRFDYSRTAIAEFRSWVEPQLPAARRRALAAAAVDDALAFPDGLPAEWRAFRTARLTALMTRLRDSVKAQRPTAIVSVAAAADRRVALDRKMQDWPAWLASGVIDAVAPMAYTDEPSRFAEQIAEARAAAGSRAVWAGIGAYRLSPAQTVDNIATARKLGAGGVILFSYDSLIDPRQSARDYLAAVARAAFAPSAADPAAR